MAKCKSKKISNAAKTLSSKSSTKKEKRNAAKVLKWHQDEKHKT